MQVRLQNLEVNDNVAEAGVDTMVMLISVLEEFYVRVNKAMVSTVGL
jgi:hypothetical protein